MNAKNNNMIYQVKPEDLDRCFKFSVDYHEKEEGSSYSRTTGQFRGLGGIIDSFFVGKLIEIGVASIIEIITGKKVLLDFEIHQVTDDPDVIGVEDAGKKRAPKIYIEIKNVSPDDRWVGLTLEQFNTILKNKIVKGDAKNAFIVCASLYSINGERDEDLLGVYLKAKIKDELFKRFCETDDLQVKIEYVFTAEELKIKGIEFVKGSYMYETEIFEEVDEKTENKVRNYKDYDAYEAVALNGKILPVIMMGNDMSKPKEFGEFEYDGNLEVIVKHNEKSKRMYLKCRSDVVIKNKVLGVFNLKKGKVYECFFTTLGRDPVLKRNNIWIANRNLVNVVSSDTKSKLKEIGEKI